MIPDERMGGKRCGNCRFWVRVSHGTWKCPGECHNHSPVHGITRNDVPYAQWPPTWPSACCGDWKAPVGMTTAEALEAE